MMKFLFYKISLPLIFWFSGLLKRNRQVAILNWLVEVNNKFVLREKKVNNPKILILLPRCLQYFGCKYNIISSVSNCSECGKCKIRDIIQLKKKYDLDVKVAPGGSLAKMFVKEVNPDIIIAVACEIELILGIKEVYPYKVLSVVNIIKEKPCIDTDVEVEKIERFITKII